MQKIYLFLAFILYCISAQAQPNLVPNPSFEQFTKCPDKASQIYFATPWKGWPGTIIYPNGSTDYYNSCDSINHNGVPRNGSVSFQYPHTGNAYAGMWVLLAFNWREYLQVELSDNLKDNCYYVEFHVNTLNSSGLAINNISAHLSDTAIVYKQDTNEVINLAPHIMQYGNPIIMDSLNWIKISGFYKAHGGEKHLVIGDFFNNANTKMEVTNWGGGGAYYYIDDVSVLELTPSFVPNWQYRDITIDKGDSIFIGTRTTGLLSKWYKDGSLINSGVPGITVNPAITSTYVVEEILPCTGQSRWDTLVVTVEDNIGIHAPAAKNELLLYPNPVKEASTLQLRLSGAVQGNWSISINDMSGKLLQTEKLKIEAGRAELELQVKPGIYQLILVNDATQEKLVRKLVVY